ncbi:MAG: DNA polymerase, partial [Candidatus Gastranaerophilales bacterium]|nr:DNA polymerase [Candidatus Gastranaerophilales bacterium]
TKGVIKDIMLESYVLDSSRKHDLKSQSEVYLDFTGEDDFLFSGAIYDLSEFYDEKLNEKEKKLAFLELKLANVLYKMEKTGVTLDCDYLKVLNSEIDIKIKEYETKIYKNANLEFNINSPKQVADVLFNVLKIKPKKKNKTGFSTNAKILDELAQDYEIARDILEHRMYMKLKNTYVDNLPKLLSEDKKIHTHYNQTVTTTGRLSSSEPNLQNIPIRTDFSNRIRAAFIASSEEYSILSADYSQIELRLLAHISKDEGLIEAFHKNIDIHTLTASKIFNVAHNEVTKEMRRKAKAVNFGIVYGQTRFGLASSLNISPFEAQEFIDKYFKTYPKISTYITNTLMDAHQNGYVETLFGRRRYLNEELNSRNARIREFAERAAINAPLQGTSADLIKMAMVELDKNLENCRAKILIQVHDELVLEVHNEEVDRVKEIVLKSMKLNEPLCVPLDVDIKTGKSWMESK